MQTPQLTDAHRSLERLVGRWAGSETMHPSPASPSSLSSASVPTKEMLQYEYARSGLKLGLQNLAWPTPKGAVPAKLDLTLRIGAGGIGSAGSAGGAAPNSTAAWLVAKFTLAAATPGTAASAFSTRATQLAQVMPSMFSVTSRGAVASGASRDSGAGWVNGRSVGVSAGATFDPCGADAICTPSCAVLG